MYALPRALYVGSLEANVIDFKERMHTCMTTGEHNEVALLEAALSLGEEMLSDHAVTFTSYVSILSKHSPRYQVLLCVGKEFID